MREEETRESATSRVTTPLRKVVGSVIRTRFSRNVALASEQRTAAQMNKPRVEKATRKPQKEIIHFPLISSSSKALTALGVGPSPNM